MSELISLPERTLSGANPNSGRLSNTNLTDLSERSNTQGSDTHPCIRVALSPQEQQNLQWHLREQLEGHQANLEALLQDGRREQRQLCQQLLQQVEAALNEQRLLFEASTLKLQRQEQKLEETLEQHFKQNTAMQVLGGKGQTFQMPSLRGSQRQEAEYEEMADRMERRSEERLKAVQEHTLGEIKKLLLEHPLFRRFDDKKRYGSGEVASSRGEPALVVTDAPAESTVPSPQATDLAVDTSKTQTGVLAESSVAQSQTLSAASPARSALAAVSGLATAANGELHQLSGRDKEAGEGRSVSATQLGGKKHMPRISAIAAIDIFSSALIILNCGWMGVEVDIAVNAQTGNRNVPMFVTAVDIVFCAGFIAELAARVYTQGTGFGRHPHLLINGLDLCVVLLQVLDLAFSVYNITWVRSIRVLRLLNALRIMRTLDYVRQLRLLLSSISNCLQPLVWILVVLLCSIYLFALVLMQFVQGSLDAHADPLLLHYWGSMGSSMMSLLKAISGGAPWQTLLQPLLDLSPSYALIFFMYWTFVSIGCLNIFTAIFVESTKIIVHRDGDLLMVESLRDQLSPINRLRNFLKDASKTNGGCLTPATLEEYVGSPRGLQLIRSLGMPRWEVVHNLQLLATDALGFVDVDVFIRALAKAKAKSDTVDLTTVLHEDRRILAAIMSLTKRSEDQYADLAQALGVESKRPRQPLVSSLQTYLPSLHI